MGRNIHWAPMTVMMMMNAIHQPAEPNEMILDDRTGHSLSRREREIETEKETGRDGMRANAIS